MLPLNILARSTFALFGWTLVGASVLAGTSFPAQSITITGSLSYLQRIALPPDSRAIVEMRAASAPDGAPVVAEQRVELEGRQVPIPFELSVDRAKLMSTKKYVVRGTILTGNRPAWVSEDIAVDLSTAVVDVGAIRLTRYQAKPAPTEMQCGTERVLVSADKGAARVVVAGQTLDMKQVPAASGTKYEAAGDPTTSYWNRGENATLVVKARLIRSARRLPRRSRPRFVRPETSLDGRCRSATMSGCGGDPRALLQGDAWIVQSIGGTPVVAKSSVTVSFGAVVRSLARHPAIRTAAPTRSAGRV